MAKYLKPLRLVETTTPGTPPTGTVELYSKADGRLYITDETGAEVGPMIGAAEAVTLQNKRVRKRVYSIASVASLVAEIDTFDAFSVTALAVNMSIDNQVTSVPINFEKIQFRIKDNGTARTLTWGTTYAALAGVALPTTTVPGKFLNLGFEWFFGQGVWSLMALGQEA